MPKRLLVLTFILLLLGAAALAQRLWFSPGQREAALARWSRQRLEQEVEKGSSDPLVYHALGRRRLEAGDFPAAVEALESALRLRPRFSRARATLGTTLLALDQDAEAALQLRRAVEDDPTAADGYMGLALLYQRNEAWALQGQAAEAATRISPENAEAWILWGDAVARQGDPDRAAGHYERAAKLLPSQARPRALASRERLAMGDFDAAERHAREAIRLEPKSPSGHLALGNVLLKRGAAHYAAAEAAYAAAVSFGEETGEALFGHGRALLLQERPAEAEPRFRLALRGRPELTEAHYGLAQALRAQGKNAAAAAAEREFQRWTRFKEEAARLHDRLAAQPSRADAWFTLARLYARMGLRDGARRYTLSGLRRAPAHPEGKKLLEQLDGGAS